MKTININGKQVFAWREGNEMVACMAIESELDMLVGVKTLTESGWKVDCEPATYNDGSLCGFWNLEARMSLDN